MGLWQSTSSTPDGWNVLPWDAGPGSENNWAAAPISQIGQWGGNDWAKLTGFQGDAYLSDRDSEGTNPAFLEHLKSQGYTPSFKKISDTLLEYQMFDKAGKPVGKAHQVRVDAKGDLTGLLSIAAMPFVVGSLNPGLVGAEAAGGAGALNTAATNPALIESAVGTAGYGASSAGLGGGAGAIGAGAGALNTGATNPALIESAVGTPGYGLSSAGAGGAAGLNPLTNLIDRVTAGLGNGSGVTGLLSGLNPNTVALVGGLLGGGGAEPETDQGPKWTADKPKVDRGDWKAKVTPTYGTLQPAPGLLNIPQGYERSGLWRFLQG